MKTHLISIVVLDSCIEVNEALQFITEHAEVSPPSLREHTELAKEFAHQTDCSLDILLNNVFVFRPKDTTTFQTSLEELAASVARLFTVQ